jgi:3-oxoacyl-[acyl-carrier-protein] synthase-3
VPYEAAHQHQVAGFYINCGNTLLRKKLRNQGNTLQMIYASKITGTGSAFPSQVVTNHDLSERLSALGVETDDQWIRERTGIRERRYADVANDPLPNTTLATTAALSAMEMAGCTPMDLDQIIVGTCSSDTLLPSTACWMQHRIGANNAWAMDINAACTGFIYGLSTASQFIATGQSCKVLVVGTEVLHPYMNWQDRTSCILFGDGAGAAIVEQVPADSEHRVLCWHLSSDGQYGDLLTVGSAEGLRPAGENSHLNGKLMMNGREIFKVAVRTLTTFAHKVLDGCNMTIADVDWFIPHQANYRILEAVAQRLGLPMEKMLINVDRFGNTSAATIPTILDEAVRDGRIQSGQTLLLDAFGAGFTYGAMIIRW